jgi:thiol-disulfide isomerase/thioredoxin
LVLSPRRLARRDLDAADGKAGDDLLVVAVVALVLEGLPALARMASLFAAGRINAALYRVHEVLAPGLPLVALWLTTAALFALFTFRSGRCAVGELGARVTTGYVLASLLVSAIAGLIGPGLAAYVLGWIPWACAAVWFGLLLREALEPPGTSTGGLARSAGAMGWTLVALVAASAGLQALQRAQAHHPGESEAIVRRGTPAPPVDLPLLDGGQLHSGALARAEARIEGKPVVMTFWATWCGPCLAELPVLERLYRARGEHAPLVYAINIDAPGPDRDRQVREVVGRLGLTIPVALDDGRAARAYSITTIPSIARVGSDGKIEEMVDRPLDEPALHDLLR